MEPEPISTSGVAAVVLAGGGARRLGGVDKLALTVGGVRLLDRVLTPLAELGWPAVVVGPWRAVADGLPEPTWARESPAGGGPAAGLAAGLTLAAGLGLPRPAGTPESTPLVAVLAGDLPHLRADALASLAAAASQEISAGGAGALAVDDDGIEQLLLGVWSRQSLLAAVSAGSRPPTAAGASVRSVLGPLRPARVVLRGEPAPWSDCDTDADLAAARAGVAPSTAARSTTGVGAR